MTFLAQIDLARLFIDRIITGTEVRLPLLVGDGGLTGQTRDDLVDLLVEIRTPFGRTRDDERGARLVDEDGVDLVDDRVEGVALHALLGHEGHVVAQIVEPELVVGAVGDVRRIGLLAGDRAQMAVTLTNRRLVAQVEEVGRGVRTGAAR